jgi:hypothetical protein
MVFGRGLCIEFLFLLRHGFIPAAAALFYCLSWRTFIFQHMDALVSLH